VIDHIGDVIAIGAQGEAVVDEARDFLADGCFGYGDWLGNMAVGGILDRATGCGASD